MSYNKSNRGGASQSYSYKLDWNDLILEMARNCAYEYSRATISPKNRVLFIAWVKNFETILINHLDKNYKEYLTKKLTKLNKKYEKHREEKDFKQSKEWMLEIDRHFIIYRALIRVVYRVGLLQTPGIKVDLKKFTFDQPDQFMEESIE